MADEEEEGAAPSQAAGGPSRYFVLIILILLLEAGGGYYVLDRVVPAPEEPAQEAPEEEEEEEWRPPIYYEDMAEMVFAPSDARGNLIVQLSLALEVDSRAVVDELTTRHTVFWALVLGRLERFSTLAVRDPVKVDLKEDVKQMLNSELKNGEVVAVYVTNFVMQ